MTDRSAENSVFPDPHSTPDAIVHNKKDVRTGSAAHFVDGTRNLGPEFIHNAVQLGQCEGPQLRLRRRVVGGHCCCDSLWRPHQPPGARPPANPTPTATTPMPPSGPRPWGLPLGVQLAPRGGGGDAGSGLSATLTEGSSSIASTPAAEVMVTVLATSDALIVATAAI